jgi:hypothetical protein
MHQEPDSRALAITGSLNVLTLEISSDKLDQSKTEIKPVCRAGELLILAIINLSNSILI